MKYLTDSNILRISNSPAELNYQSVPYDTEYNYKLTNKSNPFADLGAWFGYYFNDDNSLAFNGPNVISQEIPVNAAKYMSKTILVINGKKYEKFNNIEFEEKLGTLSIIASLKTKDFDLKITKSLLFSSSEDALITLDIKGKTKIDLEVELWNESLVYKKVKHASSNNEDDKKQWIQYFDKVTIKDNEVIFNFKPLVNKQVKEVFKMSFHSQLEPIDRVSIDNTERILICLNKYLIKANKSIDIKLNWYESFYFNKKKTEVSFSQKNIDKIKAEHLERWKSYVKKLGNNPKDKTVAYKAFVTLIGNWLAPNGVIKTDMMIPSRTYRDFIGAYAWDSFKIAYGLSYVDPVLAQKAIITMFDHQIRKSDKVRPQDAGMIPDCIFFNYSKQRKGVGENWNERNTKPPLAVWATLKVYENSKDIEFLDQIYSKLRRYMSWWQNNRKADEVELLCYGATVDKNNDPKNPKSIIEAASWESGMDNAPRFDWDRMKVINKYQDKKIIGYTINQASICLNSFYYQELVSMAKIATILDRPKEAREYEKQAKVLKNTIDKYMYSQKDGFYHDVSLEKLEPLDGYGLSVESFIPMYEKIASKDKAMKSISQLNSDNFLSAFPFPTVALNNERFDQYDYWRGPVWISFMYFAIKGIHNYVPSKGKLFKKQVISILNSKKHLNQPLRENYNSVNQDGLSTTNFSWTASMLIALIKEIKD